MLLQSCVVPTDYKCNVSNLDTFRCRGRLGLQEDTKKDQRKKQVHSHHDQIGHLLIYFQIQGSYRFWNVLESYGIESAIFQDLESSGKREVISKWLWKSFGFCLEKF